MTISATERVIPVQDWNLDELNQKFETAHPSEILAWCLVHFPTGLVQASAFNVDDMVITDILYRQLQPTQAVPVIFLDTLHHFPQTLELVEKARVIYGNLNLQIYKILDVNTREEFETKYGKTLWKTDVRLFHKLTKIEPLQRGLTELQAEAWITGRRRDQATTRGIMPIFEQENEHRIKVNPIATWTRKETWAYVMEHEVIYNPLHDQGYPSVGDEPLTTPVKDGEDERAGRWRGMGKTECGIHMED
jgi:phosphoadenosine phosphosulfate reductase